MDLVPGASTVFGGLPEFGDGVCPVRRTFAQLSLNGFNVLVFFKCPLSTLGLPSKARQMANVGDSSFVCFQEF